MNKKGFTLVELLAVVVILGILSAFIVPSVFKMVKNAKQNSYNVLVSSFEENARLYVSRHREEVESYLDTYNYFTITLTDLKENNLLKIPLKDPRTDETIALTKKIYISREENQTLSVCFEDNNCYAPITLTSKVTDVSNVVTGTNEGLHQDTTNNFYYYAGTNPKNWVLFNDILWRIVKVNSDGSVKLIYEGTKEKNGTEQDGNISNRTFDDTSVNNYNSTTSIKTYLTNWYNTTLTAGNKAKVQAVNWCVGTVTYSTSGVSKASMLSGECATKTTATYTVGLLSASEYIYGSLDTGCTTSYKTSDDYGYACKNQNYLYKSFYNYFTLTRDNDATDVWPVNSTGSVGPVIPASNSMGTRPVIVLSNTAIIDRGDGTIDSPYTIRDIITVDKASPVITLLGSSPVNINVGDNYIDAGVTATDNVDGDVTSKVIKTSDLNPNHYGNYTVTYIVSDASGNKTTIKRSVNVSLTVDVLVVAGGGGGGMDMGGGGGGGGVIYRTSYRLNKQTTPLTVGKGGNGAPAAGTNGQPTAHQYTIPATSGENSGFDTITAYGGGFGGSSYRLYAPGIAGGNGGSGGGASGYNDTVTTYYGGTGVTGQGNRGGNTSATYYSGGGGGAGGAGVDSPSQPNGGIGIQCDILGTNYYWGGGGGGASYSLSVGGNGGAGGGGGGAVGVTTGGSGLNPGMPGGGGNPNEQTNKPGGDAGANTGGGGGGGSHYNANNKGGNGGSGIVVIRYLGSPRATGGTITSVGGYTIHTFTTTGSSTFTIQ